MSKEENALSEKIAEFLAFLRESEALLRISAQNEQEANDATQDILHMLELNETAYHDGARLAQKLAEIRRQRRAAKDLYGVVAPIAAWAESNKAVIKSLERLLGDVRRAEKLMQNRTYTQKTGVLKERENGKDGNAF